MADLRVRLADPAADRDILDHLFGELQRDYGAAETVDAPGHVGDTLGQHPGCEVLLAECNGRTVGFASFSIIFPNADLRPILYLRLLYVETGARSSGAGTRLMQCLADLAVKRGCTRMDWTTDTGNQRAQAFYERLGGTHMTHTVNYRLNADALDALAQGDGTSEE